MGWDGVGWRGMGWDGVGRMGWGGMGWGGMGSDEIGYDRLGDDGMRDDGTGLGLPGPGGACGALSTVPTSGGTANRGRKDSNRVVQACEHRPTVRVEGA